MRRSYGGELTGRVAMRRNNRPKTARLIAREIVEEIIGSGLGPGSTLPPEREMLEKYGVGRGTLREAIRYLEFQGVLSLRPGRGGGPVVTAPDAAELASTLTLFLAVRRTPFADVVETRAVLEPVMAAQAAERATEEQLAALGASVVAMEKSLASESDFWAENLRFHDVVAQASGNDVFMSLVMSLHSIIDGTAIGIEYSGRRRRAIARAHREIYEAIETRHPDKAREAMYRHLRDWNDYLLRRHASVLKRPVKWSAG